MRKFFQGNDDTKALVPVGNSIGAELIRFFHERDIAGVADGQVIMAGDVPGLSFHLTSGAAFYLPQLPVSVRRRLEKEYLDAVAGMEKSPLEGECELPGRIGLTIMMNEFRRSRKKLEMRPIVTLHFDDMHVVCHGAPLLDDFASEWSYSLLDPEEARQSCMDLLENYLLGPDAWLSFHGEVAKTWLELCIDSVCDMIDSSNYVELADREGQFGFMISLNGAACLEKIGNAELREKCAAILGGWRNPGRIAAFLVAGEPDPLSDSCMFSMHGPMSVSCGTSPDIAWECLKSVPIWSMNAPSRVAGVEGMNMMHGDISVFEYESGKAACDILDIFQIGD